MNIVYAMLSFVMMYLVTFLLYLNLPVSLDIDTKSEAAKQAYRFKIVLAKRPRFADFYFMNFFIVVGLTVLIACFYPNSFGIYSVISCVVTPVVLALAQTQATRQSSEDYASGEFFMAYKMYVHFY